MLECHTRNGQAIFAAKPRPKNKQTMHNKRASSPPNLGLKSGRGSEDPAAATVSASAEPPCRERSPGPRRGAGAARPPPAAADLRSPIAAPLPMMMAAVSPAKMVPVVPQAEGKVMNTAVAVAVAVAVAAAPLVGTPLVTGHVAAPPARSAAPSMIARSPPGTSAVGAAGDDHAPRRGQTRRSGPWHNGSSRSRVDSTAPCAGLVAAAGESGDGRSGARETKLLA